MVFLALSSNYHMFLLHIPCLFSKIENIVVLRRHTFIARLQANYIAKIREGPREGEVLVIGDIAENYTFVLQDAALGFHWNNS